MGIWHSFQLRDTARTKRSQPRSNRQGKWKKRGKSRGNYLESLEGRLLLTSGPQLISIIPNDGSLLLANETLHTAPSQLTFRFLLSAGETLDPTTLGGIQLARSGEDAVFGNSNDAMITPGFVGIDPAQPNQAVLRFSSPLPDDLYRVTIVGAGPDALKDSGNPPLPFNGGQNYSQDFRLALGPRVLAVVPQPVRRDGAGALQAHANEIDVYFDKPVATLPDQPARLDPGQFQLIATRNTATSLDDAIYVADPHATFVFLAADETIHVPGRVEYDARNHEAKIQFQVANLPIDISSLDSGPFRLRIGNSDQRLPEPATPVVYSGGANGAYTGAQDLLALGPKTRIFSGNLRPQTIDVGLVFPGGIDDPGHRQIPVPNENHALAAPGGVVTIDYSFPVIYGKDPTSGSDWINQITENQKQTVRQIFQLYSYYTGITFVEIPQASVFQSPTLSPGALYNNTFAVGDLRALDPTPPAGAAGLGGPGAVVINGNDNWGASLFGSGFMRVAMHEIGHALGLPHDDDGPPGTIMNGGAEGASPSSGPAPEPIFPGLADITNLLYGYETNSNQIDLYKFSVTSPGTLSAQTQAQQLATVSTLNTLLSLYEQFSDLNLPASGAAISNGHVFTIANTSGPSVTATFEFTLDNSQINPTTGKLPDGAFGVYFSAGGTRQDLAVSVVAAVQNAARVAGLNVSATIGAAGVRLAGPISVNVAAAPELSVAFERSLVARNDDYFGKDSFVRMQLSPGIYYVAVTSTGNDQFDPNVANSGWGGRTYGSYQLLLDFQPAATSSLTDPGLSLFVPANPITGPGSIPDGYSFTLTDANAGQPATETIAFYNGSTAPPNAPGRINIQLQAGDTQYDVAEKIIAALRQAIADGGFDASKYLLANIGDGRIEVGGGSGTKIVVDPTGNGALTGTPLVLWGDGQRDALVGNSNAGGAGAYNFWFNVGATIYVDKTATAAQQAAGVAANGGGPSRPLYRSIQEALGDPAVAAAAAGGELVNIRAEGNAFYSLAIAQDQSGAAQIKAGDTFQVSAGQASAGAFARTFEFVASGADNEALPNGNFAVLLGDGSASDIAYHLVQALRFAVQQLPNGGTATLADADVTVSDAGFDAHYRYVRLYQGRFPLSVNYSGARPTSFNPALPGVTPPALYNNAPYLVGTDQFGTLLPDNSPGDSILQLPKNVVLMIDAGAVFKLDHANIEAGSSAVNIDHSQSAIQALGVPGNQVVFTSYNDDSPWFGAPEVHPGLSAKPGDWGGLVFNNDSDLESLGVFLNSATEARLDYGGGQVTVNGVPQFYDAIYLNTARPTISNNLIVNSASAAISANPNSFEDTRFGSVQTITAAGVPFDGEKFDVGAATFEFDNNGVVGQGNIAVAFSGLTGAQIATNIAAAINNSLLANSPNKAESLQNVVTLPKSLTVVNYGPAISHFADVFSSDYQRFGPDVHGNMLSQGALTGAPVYNPNGSGKQIGLTYAPATQNTINGLFVRIATNAGQTLDTLDVSAEFAATDIPYILQENLIIHDDLGYTYALDALGQRHAGQLLFDPGVVVKLAGSRIEAGMGSSVIAEGTAAEPVVFTSLDDVRYGGGGTFDTPDNGGGVAPRAGDWGGFYFWPTSSGSIDHALVTFGGGATAIEGGFAPFDAVEIHQAKVRIADSTLENNASAAAGDRNGRQASDAAVVYVLGAQPVIVNNVIQNNAGAAVSIDAQSLSANLTPDWGRAVAPPGGYGGLNAGANAAAAGIAGPLAPRYDQFDDNYGPLVRLNRIGTSSINGMRVRGGTLQTASVWDDTDVVHVLQDAISSPNFASVGGLRLQSSDTQGLVVKLLGSTAGIAASGAPLDISDRIGGSVQILGTPQHPVVLTSLHDSTVGAGLTPDGQPNNNTDNSSGQTALLPTVPNVDRGTLIDNNVDPNVVGHFEADIGVGGDLGSTNPIGVTAQGKLGKLTNANFVFEYGNYVLVGGSNSAKRLSATTITQSPTLIAPDVVESKGNFQGENGIVNWTVTSSFQPGTEQLVNVISLSSAQPIGELRFINYLDEDVPPGASDDLLYSQGTPGQPGFQVFTIDGPQRVGVSQGGVYVPGSGLNNATFVGWAADSYANLRRNIVNGVQTFSIVGNINTANDPPFVDPELGQVYGPVDQTTAFAWDVAPTATSSTVTTFLNEVASPPSLSGEWQGITLDQFSNDRNVAMINKAEPGSTPATAQSLGVLAPNQQSGDDNSRLGFQVNGFLDAEEVDAYTFKGTAGSQLWFDLTRTSPALDAVLELVDANGNVLARSDNSLDEQRDANFADPLLAGALLKTELNGNLAQPLQGRMSAVDFKHFWSTNRYDPGFRAVLPGTPGAVSSYYVRVYAKGPSAPPTVNLAGVPAPIQNIPVPAPSGGNLATGTYYYQVTALTPAGETTANGESATSVTGPTGKATISWLPVAGATGYRIYRGGSPGKVNVLAGVVGATTSFVDTGANLSYLPDKATPIAKSYGLSGGQYQLQIRLQQLVELPGSTVVNADIRYATNAIEVIGLPAHSPLVSNTAAQAAPHNSFGSAQDIGNLLASDTASINLSGNLAGGGVDWYKFQLTYQEIQGLSGAAPWSTMFNVGYADGLTRPDTVLDIYDANGRLIYVGRDSNVADQQPRPNAGLDANELGHSSFGTLDPFIGPVHLNPGTPTAPVTFYVAIHGSTQLPRALDGTFASNSLNYLVRLEPVDSVNRVAEDHISAQGGQTDQSPGSLTPLFGTQSDQSLPKLNSFATPYGLSDVVLFASTGSTGTLSAGVTQGHLLTFDPFTGGLAQTDQGPFAANAQLGFNNIAMRNDGELYGLSWGTNDANSGNLVQIDAGTPGSDAVRQDDGVVTYKPDPANANTMVAANVGIQYDALTFEPGANGTPGNMWAIGHRTGDRADTASDRKDPNWPSGYEATMRNLLFQFVWNASRGRYDPAGSATGFDLDGKPNAYSTPVNFGSTSVGAPDLYFPMTQLSGLIGGANENITGLAAIGSVLYAVSNKGYLYTVNGTGGTVTPVVSTQEITVPGGFTSLTAGPQHVNSGRYQNDLFATDVNGRLYAFSTNSATLGLPDQVFTGLQSSVSLVTPGATVKGIAFSTLDSNLWHVTSNRGGDAGGPTNGTSFYFGLDNTRPGASRSEYSTNPAIQNGPDGRKDIFDYNLPGGAGGSSFGALTPEGDGGSLTTNAFSLANYAAADKPTLYFTYYLGAGAQDAARVLISPDNGSSWLDRSGALYDAVDSNTGWRQARIDLSPFVGIAEIKLRFHFSTGNYDNPERGRDNLHEGWYVSDLVVGFAERGEQVIAAAGNGNPGFMAVGGSGSASSGPYQLEIRRGADYGSRTPNNSFDTNDRLAHAYSLVVPPGGLLGGQTFTLNDGMRSVTFQFVDSPFAAAPGNVAVVVQAWDSAELAAQKIVSAINDNPTLINVSASYYRNSQNFVSGAIAATNLVTLFNVAEAKSSAPFLSIKHYDLFGDATMPRPQGQIILSGNQISNASQNGILVEGVPHALIGDGPTLPYPGGSVNTPTLNSAGLAPGVVIENNLIYGVAANGAGIAFKGTVDPADGAPASVPFGRIVNNTIFGGIAASGVGIDVADRASPTLLNNILAGLQTGIRIDGSSQSLPSPPVLGENVYQGNGSNSNVGLGSFDVALSPTEPLFTTPTTNPATANFYLVEGSKAIDSSINSLQDRVSATSVTGPIGIPPSPILAPSYDLYGQLRIDDPNVANYPGLGQNVFVDRGAVERTDTVGPSAALLAPVDNDASDLTTSRNVVFIRGQNLAEFAVQLNDGSGSGIYDPSVSAARVAVREDGRLLTSGVDYFFEYDNNNHIIHLVAASGAWLNGHQYDVYLDNGNLFDPADPAAAPVGIADRAGNLLQANAPDGLTHFRLLLANTANSAPLVQLRTAGSLPLAVFENSPAAAHSAEFTFSAPFSSIEPASVSISIYDVDANGGAETLTLQAAHGTLSLSANALAELASIGVVPGSGLTGNGTSTLTITAPLGEASAYSSTPGINAALEGLRFTPDLDFDSHFGALAMVTASVNDNGNSPTPSLTTSLFIPIYVAPINDSPSFTAGADQTVDEDSGPQTVLSWATDISAGGNEWDQALDFQISNDNSSLFSAGPAIDPLTGNLTYTPAANAYGVAHVTVKLHDDGGAADGGIDASATQSFTITVNPVNDSPSFTAGGDQTVPEDSGPQTVPAWAKNISPGPNEPGETVDFQIASDNPGLFLAAPAIDAATGDLTYTPAPNAYGVAHVTVKLHDNGGTARGGIDTSAAQAFTITVAPVNDAPSFIAGSDQSVAEDAGPQTVSAWATSIGAGPNEASQSLNFLISTNNSGLFAAGPSIDPVTGDLTYTPAPNAYGAAQVTVQLHDDGGTAAGGGDASAARTFTIVVVAVNDAPSFAAGPDQTVNEDAGPQTVAAWATNISAGPNESGQLLNFVVSSDNPSLFAAGPSIDPATGNLAYTPAPNLNGVAHVTLQLHDNGGTALGGVETSATQTFTITVNSVNDAPSFTAGADQTVLEDLGAQVVSPWATNISPGPNEAGQTVDFLLANDNPGLFSSAPSIDPASGALTYAAAPNAYGVAHVTVRLHDNGGATNGGVDTSAPQILTITVSQVNDVPSFTAGGNQGVLEDAGPQSVSAWATAISAGPNEASQTLDFLFSSDNPGLFSAGPSIDPATGNLTYTPAANANGLARVTVQLHDNGGTAGGGVDTSAAQTFTISVTPVNDAPRFTTGGHQSVPEDAGPQTAPAWAANISPGPNEAGQAVNFLISSDNPGLFSASPSIDPVTGNLTFTPAANAYGVAQVTVQLHDDGGTVDGGVETSAAQTFTITVIPVNDAPSFIAGPDQTVDENAGPQTVLSWATGISPGPNESAQALDFLVSSDNPGLFAAGPTIDAATGALAYTPSANASGVAHVTVRLHDNGGTAGGGVETSVPQSFTITVNFVNHAPSFTAGPHQTVDEDAPLQSASNWATNISPGPGANEAAEQLDFLVSTDNAALFSTLPSIDPATGTLIYQPAPNASGTANVTVRLHDNGGTANVGADTSAPQTFTITVNSVNDVPSFAAGPDQAVDEDAGPQTIANWASSVSPGPGANEAGQTLNFLVSTDNSALFSSQPAIDASGKLRYTPAPNANGIAHVTVQLHDNGGTANGGTANGGVDTSAAQTFAIAVNSVNDAPSFTGAGDQLINENSGQEITVIWAKSITPGPLNEASQRVNFLVSSDNPGWFSEQPSIDPNGILTYRALPYQTGTAHVTVQLHDNGGTANGGVEASATQTFAITINPVNQPPSFVAGASQTVNEDSGAQSVAGWATSVGAGPNEASQTVNFLITSDNPGLFSAGPAVDASTGTLSYAPAPNVSGVAHVSVQLHDNGGTANGGVDTSAVQTFTITVNPVNDAPGFTAGGDQTVLEDSGAQTVPAWATNLSAGPNEASQTLNFLVASDNSALFASAPAIDPATGNLTYTPAANAYGVAHVTVQLHDNGGTARGGGDTSAVQTFAITVTQVNDVPRFTAGGNQSVLEDAGLQSVSAWATAISAGPNEAGQALDFLISSDNPGLFSAGPSIDPATGNLTYTPAANANGLAHVTVQLHDNGGTAGGGVDTSATQSFTITVRPVNDAPSFTAGPDQAVNQDVGAQTVAAWAANLSDGPNESGQTLNFIVSSDNSALFSTQPVIDASGKLTYTPAAHAFGQAHVTVQLHDNGGTATGGGDTSAVQTFTIGINFVNKAPSFTGGANQTVDENAAAQTVAAWAKNINQGAFETGQTLDFIVTSDNAGLFAAGPAVDPITGALTYTPAPNMSGVANVTVALHDDGGTANGGADTSAQQTFTITVRPVNQAPSFQIGPDETVDENSGAQTFANWATQISAGPNEASQTVNFLESVDNPSLFSAGPAIDSAGNLSFTPAANKRGTALVTVSLHDDGGAANGGVDHSANQTFQIVISPVNNAPTVATPIADQTLNENAADAVFNVASLFDDVDIPYGDHLTLSLAGNDNASLVDATLAGGQLTLHLLPNQFGLAHLDLRATDDAGATVDNNFAVTVNAVNQAPRFTKGADQRVSPEAGLVVAADWASAISAGPANEAGQPLSFQVTGDTNPSLFLVPPSVDAASGNLSFQPAPGAVGTATITLVLKDSGGAANGGHDASPPQTFRITVNEAPVAQADSFVLSTNSASSATAAAGVLSNDTDPNGDALTAQRVSGPSHGTLTLNSDGSFTYVKGADFAGLDQFSYQASDGMANSGVVTVRILSYEASIVEKLYNQVLHRGPEDSGLLYWTNRIQNGDPYGVIAQGIFESNERLDPIIEQYYHDYLLRAADAAGLAYWRDQVWKHDGGPENVIAGMISSAEFFQSAGGTNSAWVQALYQRLLNRPADPRGLAYWTNQLELHLATEQQVVRGFTDSDENFKNLITGFYQQYLQRDPSLSELSGLLEQLRAGATQRDIQLEIINSQEYRNTPPPPAAGSITRFFS